MGGDGGGIGRGGIAKEKDRHCDIQGRDGQEAYIDRGDV